MALYLLAGTLGGILFAVMDALINANPLAVRLLSAYKPIARPRVKIAAGIIIDLAYGLILAALFLFTSPLLTFAPVPLNGLLFGCGIWFLRVAMSALSNWMMFAVPFKAIAYQAISGLFEILLLGVLYSLILMR